MSQRTRYQQVRFITLIGAFVNITLAVCKITVGIWGQSQALIADGLHSFSDLLTDGLVLLAAKVGDQAADAEHPYGHRRFETLATAILALFLLLVGGAILVDGGFRLWHHHAFPVPDRAVIYVAILSVAMNEILFRWTLRVGRRVQSDLLIANAWHARSDAASSLVVLIGVIAAVAGFPRMDDVAALIVGILIIRMGCRLVWRNIQELVDTGVAPVQLQRIIDIIGNVPGVVDIHELRTRSMAGAIFVDVHVIVGTHISVSEGHYIGERVRAQLIREHEAVSDVTVHIDPENDEIVATCTRLPDRAQLIEQIKQLWPARLPNIQDYLFHYLDGQIEVDLFFPLAMSPIEVPEEVLTLAAIRRVTVYYTA